MRETFSTMECRWPFLLNLSFPDAYGADRRCSYNSSLWKKVRKLAGIDDVRLHDCRIERPDTRQHLTACTEPTKNCLHQRGRCRLDREGTPG